ncbi:16S rRNA (guanine(966)-N(2))-methyltransferase RsmD [Canibacter sp. lx-72]|uniref:16S rRNA (guanine(966)-N(2))-methyltransferase RsmD n=1 Tax=Canibacter zhuwentaonis TaxID=2837491 RepID=UPI001BDCA88C|nr:16S rRNA (guanine(966)-N(2))-methyltransferase RsmD [Canibacter zhuwentaonis]MBT1018187.1 16S rRNA (guanine(966)-N(2))-methyltransferase RsmD [Canibacter zhuwentaonis]
MTRIIAGDASSLRMKVPERGTRPTSDRVREAIFSALDAWNYLTDTRVLDLYAGSGALGVEALSRGAEHATFVEKHTPTAKIIDENFAAAHTAISAVGRTITHSIYTQSVQKFLIAHPPVAPELRYDVVFIDPPYDFSDAIIAENLASLTPLLKADALVMIERSKRSPEPAMPQFLRIMKRKNYGETSCWWAERI